MVVTPSRVAAGLAWLTGLGFGLPAVYGTVHFARTAEVLAGVLLW